MFCDQLEARLQNPETTAGKLVCSRPCSCELNRRLRAAAHGVTENLGWKTVAKVT